MVVGISVERRPRIVGGTFGLPDSRHSVPVTAPPFVRPDDLLLVNARSALLVLLQQLRPQSVWLPSFLCPVLVAVVSSRAEVRWYDVGDDLSPGPSEWIDQVTEGDFVVSIDYFGFRTGIAYRGGLRQRGAVIVEDACQALLTDGVGEDADFVLFSPRKYVGVPDGGVLSARSFGRGSEFTVSDFSPPPAAWWQTALSASTQRAEFDEHGGNNHWFELFQQSEDATPAGRYAMSDLTRRLLGTIDYTEIATRRRENYDVLLTHLPEFALLPDLEPGVVPLGFPVRVSNRADILEHLYSHDIFPPVHWRIDGVVPTRFAASHMLAKEILTLPCDQRYDVDTMLRMARLFREKGRPCTDI